MTNSESNEIIDAAGNPITRIPTVRDRIKGALQSLRHTILWSIGAIAILAALITNGGKIIDAVWPKTTPAALTVPNVAVKLRNPGNVEIALAARGEYWLWPPGGGVQHYSGAYEFKQLDSSDLEMQAITLPPNGEREFLVHLTNPALATYLRTGDYHIDFIFRTNQGGRHMVWSGPIPFTEKALSKAYLIDVFEKADAETE